MKQNLLASVGICLSKFLSPPSYLNYCFSSETLPSQSLITLLLVLGNIHASQSLPFLSVALSPSISTLPSCSFPISLYLQSYYLLFLSLPCYSTALQLRKGWDKARPRASSYSFKASMKKNKCHTNTWSIYINRSIAHSYKCCKYSQSAQHLVFVLSTLFYHYVL